MPKDTGLEELLASDDGPVEVLRFYNNTITLRYNAKLHAYYLEEDGVKYLVPGATTVCGMIDKSGPLTQWAANMAIQFIREKLDLLEDNPEKFIIKIGSMSFNDVNALLEEARFNFRTISKNATDIGHEAHEWLEKFIKAQMVGGKPIVYTDGLEQTFPANAAAANCVSKAIAWMLKHQFIPIHSESKIYSRKYGYSGTLDWIGHVTACGDWSCCPFIGTQLELGDFKSSRSLYDEYRAQTAAYQAAWEEEHPDIPLSGRRLLRLGKDGDEFESVFYAQEEFDSDFDGFIGALSVYNWMRQIELNRRFDKAEAKAKAKAEKAVSKRPKVARKAPRKPVIPERKAIEIEVVSA